MNIRRAAFFALALGLSLPTDLFAQPGYLRGSRYRKAKEESPAPRKEKKRRKAEKNAENEVKNSEATASPEPSVPLAGTDKKSIEAYLQGRLGTLQKRHAKQENFGRGMGLAWKNFWQKIYEERKLFEVRMARQRLNLFESLSSLDPAYHGQTIMDFEKLQGNVIKSFEADQKGKVDEYFTRQISDLRDFSAEQETLRIEALDSALQSWRAQKAALDKKTN